jgi:hypothetical protein
VALALSSWECYCYVFVRLFSCGLGFEILGMTWQRVFVSVLFFKQAQKRKSESKKRY